MLDVPDSRIDERMTTTLAAHLQAHGMRVKVQRQPVGKPAELVERGQARLTSGGGSALLWIHTIPATAQRPGTLRLYVYERGAEGLVGREVEMPAGETSASLETMANVATAVATAVHEQGLARTHADTQATDPDRSSGLVGEELGLVPVSKTGELVTSADKGEKPAGEGEKPADDGAAPTDTSDVEAGANDRVKAADDVRTKDVEDNDKRAAKRVKRDKPPRKKRTGPPQIQLSLAYVGNSFAREIPWQSGLGLGIGYLISPSAFLGIGYEVVVPSRVNSLGVETILRRHPIIVEGSYRVGVGQSGRWDIGMGARLSLDPIVRVARVQGMTPLTANDNSLRLFSSLAPVISVGYSPVSQVRMSLNLGLDIVLSRAQYRAYIPAPMTLIDPHPLRFVAGFRLDFGVLRRPKKN